MKTETNGRPKQLGITVVLILGVVAVVSSVLGFSTISTRNPESDLLAGITIDNSLTETDTRYLQTSLQWLRVHLPDWYAYVAQAKPIIFAMDEQMQAYGVISNANCCNVGGAGVITFGGPLGQWKISEVTRIEGIQVQQIQFLSVLIHEVTHIRDQREGRIGEAVDSKTCIAAERSANDKELEFVRALAAAQIEGAADARANYRLVVDNHFKITQDHVEGVSWKIFCIMSFNE